MKKLIYIFTILTLSTAAQARPVEEVYVRGLDLIETINEVFPKSSYIGTTDENIDLFSDFKDYLNCSLNIERIDISTTLYLISQQGTELILISSPDQVNKSTLKNGQKFYISRKDKLHTIKITGNTYKASRSSVIDLKNITVEIEEINLNTGATSKAFCNIVRGLN